MAMNILVGTSGYAYKEWKGSFYPEKMPAKGMLRYYGERFGTVEINASFYRLPVASTLTAWTAEVPADFRFAMKAPQAITHFQRLKGSEKSVMEFVKVAGVLGGRLGPLLFGLPPNMKKDATRLREFLEMLPSKGARFAFEFRHQSWFDDEVLGLLKRHKVALCVADADDELEVPRAATTDFGYVRLRRAEYTGPALKKWGAWIAEQKWKEAFVFFKHEDEGKGPRFAVKLVEVMGG
jgi:uncharacterized protein YecE (DUF72 family)